ncbi:MAG TPA: glycosyltransferase, partial [Candidatus Polarisedimenticolaceae bacterium]|nr:glycosyltransferase [Candidatus Polarisedimenticolaceae bacterium]
MSKNIYQPSFLSAANESLSEIAATANEICEVNTTANGDGVISRHNDRDTRWRIRELNTRRQFHHRWAKDGRDAGVGLTDLNALRGNIHALAMPEIKRLSMLPNRVERNPLVTLWRRLRGTTSNNDRGRTDSVSGERAVVGWRAAAASRRLLLIALIIIQTAIATWSLSNTFPYPWLKPSEIAILVLFAVLFSWISLGFWSAVAGFWMLWRRKNEFTRAELPIDERQPLRSRTAVLMPICNEDVTRVFAGLEASYRSLAETPQFASFDFFILSDTGDPVRQAEEEIAWAQLCAAVQGFGRIFYRHRRNNVRRKSGNIADFLRRWGRDYDYMIVFDADSIVAGETVVRLAQMMEQYPQAGIIQTA